MRRLSTVDPVTLPASRPTLYAVVGVHVMVSDEVESTLLESSPTVPKKKVRGWCFASA